MRHKTRHLVKICMDVSLKILHAIISRSPCHNTVRWAPLWSPLYGRGHWGRDREGLGQSPRRAAAEPATRTQHSREMRLPTLSSSQWVHFSIVKTCVLFVFDKYLTSFLCLLYLFSHTETMTDPTSQGFSEEEGDGVRSVLSSTASTKCRADVSCWYGYLHLEGLLCEAEKHSGWKCCFRKYPYYIMEKSLLYVQEQRAQNKNE